MEYEELPTFDALELQTEEVHLLELEFLGMGLDLYGVVISIYMMIYMITVY